jgi:uncharacterized membrane protein
MIQRENLEVFMDGKQEKYIPCEICRKKKPVDDMIPIGILRYPLMEILIKQYPDISKDGFICRDDLNELRAQYVREVLENEKGEITVSEEQVVKSLKEQDLLSKNINVEFEQRLTIGNRFSDKLATVAGSWCFIACFLGILFAWIVINSIALLTRPFDPYPYILLNLVLSCLAAIQAPVILMSQNRQEAKDRLRAEHDYLINLKAELEIRHLHEKMDHLLMHQWQRLLEIQQIQTELMQELTRKKQI